MHAEVADVETYMNERSSGVAMKEIAHDAKCLLGHRHIRVSQPAAAQTHKPGSVSVPCAS